MEETSSGEEYRMSTPEIKDLLSLLDAIEYERLGSASVMQGCYARVYLGDRKEEYCELMLSEDGILANPIKGGKKAQLYELRSGGTVLKNYVKWCINRKDPTVPEDLFDQIDQLLCDMPLGEYVLGEVVFEDSAWEASYAETFDEGPADLRCMFSGRTARGEQRVLLPLFHMGRDHAEKEQLRLAVPQRKRRRLERHERCEAAPRKCARLARHENG